jgi:arylsulfatase A-like enzyme/Flp pilus assembly protein TadD
MPAAGEPRPSVLLVTVDTLRADALGAYGRAAAGTPWIDRLAAGGVRFADAHAHNVVTLPSHANILSGRYPTEHGVRDNAGFRFPARLETLATRLRAAGYRTGAFVSAFPLASRFGLGAGFDVYDDTFVDAEARPAFLEQERRGTETVSLARRWLEAGGERPSFCWVHVYEPHFPYRAPEPFASELRGDAYQAEVAAADAALGPLLEPLLAAGREGRTLVVLTADHGESLGEHGEATHGIFAYEATLKVPLILYLPRLMAPRVVSSPARHVDVLPTVLDVLSLPLPAGLPGRTLLPDATGRPAPPETPSYFEALSGRLNRGWAPLHGVIREGTKYVDLPVPELYDLRSDPHERQNLAASDPRRMEPMRALLAPLVAGDAVAGRRREDAQTRQRLRSLGYLAAPAGASPARYGEDDDPKRLIGLDTRLQEVFALYTSGDLASALARCRELVRLRPGMSVSLLALAHLERERGNLDAAVEALRKAVALDPDDTVAAALLGATLTQAGRAPEAAALLEPYAGRGDPDVDVLVARALALAKLGRTSEALATLARAGEVEPSNAMVLVDAGTVHLMARQPDEARRAFEAALARNPGVVRAETSLAFMAAESGRREEALERFKRAVALDPREHDKLLALSLMLWQGGRRDEARPYLELFVASAPAPQYARDIARARDLLSR